MNNKTHQLLKVRKWNNLPSILNSILFHRLAKRKNKRSSSWYKSKNESNSSDYKNKDNYYRNQKSKANNIYNKFEHYPRRRNQ